MADIKIKKLGKQAVAEMLATVCRGKGCPATYELGCPFKNGEGDSVPCGLVDTDLWLAAIEEGKPRFEFGDKVTHCIDFPVRAVFSAYKDSLYSDEAYILLDSCPECEVVLVSNLKAGWE